MEKPRYRVMLATSGLQSDSWYESADDYVDTALAHCVRMMQPDAQQTILGEQSKPMYVDEIADADEETVDEEKAPSQVIMVDSLGEAVEQLGEKITVQQSPSKDKEWRPPDGSSAPEGDKTPSDITHFKICTKLPTPEGCLIVDQNGQLGTYARPDTATASGAVGHNSDQDGCMTARGGPSAGQRGRRAGTYGPRTYGPRGARPQWTPPARSTPGRRAARLGASGWAEAQRVWPGWWTGAGGTARCGAGGGPGRPGRRSGGTRWWTGGRRTSGPQSE